MGRTHNFAAFAACFALVALTSGCGDDSAVVGTGTASTGDTFSLPDLTGGDTGKTDAAAADAQPTDSQPADTQLADATPANTAPKLSFAAPAEGAVLQAGAPVSVELLASDDGGAAALTVQIAVQGAATPLWTGKPGADGKVTAALSGLAPGAIKLQAKAADSQGLTAEASVSLYLNTPPGAPVVGIAPATPTVVDALTAKVLQDSQDADRKPSELKYSFAWSKDGQGAGIAADTVPAGTAKKGELWKVAVIAEDPTSKSAPGEAQVVIGDALASTPTVALDPQAIDLQSEVSAAGAGAVDADGEVVTYTYQWLLNGQPLEGATAAQIKLASTLAPGGALLKKGDKLSCQVTAWSAGAAGGTATSAELAISGVDLCATAQNPCDSNASCAATDTLLPTCTCKPGYGGDGQYCGDLNECLVDNGGCGLAADCSNTAGSSVCSCKAGYAGTGKDCTDIDECAAGTAGCATTATCENTVGGATCTCNSGYTGDGTTCSDADECAVDNGGCGTTAFWVCTNQVGKAPACSDLNECAKDNGGCGDATFWSCSNNQGAAPTCGDIDECATNNGGCGSADFWTCKNNPGAAATCTDIDECLSDNGGCGDPKFWTCKNNSGSAATCTDIDECATNNGGCGDAPFMSCQNEAGKPPTCKDVNECATNNGGCGDPAHWSCTNNFGDVPTCSDIDECSSDNGGCGDAKFFKCLNQVGTAPKCDTIALCGVANGGCGDPTYYLCSEQPGGLPACSDIDECLLGNGGCGNAQYFACLNQVGGPAKCLDINECLTDNGGCGNPAFTTCSNNAGALPTCSDINECMTNNGGCGDAKYWNCKNNDGAPPTCSDVDECLVANGGCGDAKYIACANNKGAAPTCTDTNECATNNGGCGDAKFWACKNNYAVAPSCTDINECLTSNGGCGDPAAWSCSNNAGAAPTCADINECLTNNGGCGAKNTCTNSAGGFACSWLNCVAVRDAGLPSGEYSVNVGGPRKVYCDSTTAGGGWTFVNPADIQGLASFDLDGYRTDKANALIRLVGSYGQAYTLIKQLPAYATYPMAVAILSAGSANPAAGYNIHLTIIPLTVAKAFTVQGFNSNGADLTFSNCDSNPNSYFEFYAAGAGYDFNTAYALTNGWLGSKLAGGSVPAGYFANGAMHDGGCGAHNTTSQWTGVDGTTGVAIGLR